MTREELDALWFQAMRQSIEAGEDFIRYHFAALVAAEKDKEIERLREVLNKLEYFCDGTIRRYPDEHEVEVALRREEQ